MYGFESNSYQSEDFFQHQPAANSSAMRASSKRKLDCDIGPGESSDVSSQCKKRRSGAAGRERVRLRQFNEALESLQSAIPIRLTQNRKLHKKQTLQLAIRYINFLNGCLSGERQWSERSRFWCKTEDELMIDAIDAAGERNEPDPLPNQLLQASTQFTPYQEPSQHIHINKADEQPGFFQQGEHYNHLPVHQYYHHQQQQEINVRPQQQPFPAIYEPLSPYESESSSNGSQTMAPAHSYDHQLYQKHELSPQEVPQMAFNYYQVPHFVHQEQIFPNCDVYPPAPRDHFQKSQVQQTYAIYNAPKEQCYSHDAHTQSSNGANAGIMNLLASAQDALNPESPESGFVSSVSYEM